MGMSANQGLKLAADACFAKGDIAEGNRLMKMYYNGLNQAKKHEAERKINELNRKQKLEEKKRKRIK